MLSSIRLSRLDNIKHSCLHLKLDLFPILPADGENDRPILCRDAYLNTQCGIYVKGFIGDANFDNTVMPLCGFIYTSV